MADIFVSYASEDRERVAPLVNCFEKAGWSVWWDRQIATGESFDRVIEREIEVAGCVVVVWSGNSLESRWVRNEATEGLERDVLAPVLIDDVKPPLAFRSAHAANLTGWPQERHDKNLSQLIVDIRKIVGAAPSMPSRSIRDDSNADRREVVLAILPLTDLTEERDMGHICDGLAEDLMNATFQLGDVRVLAARDTFAFRDSHTGTRAIGEKLRATMVLEGSVRRAGNRLAANARLIDVPSGRTVYSEQLIEDFEDAFDFQSRIAAAIFTGIRVHLAPARSERIEVDTSSRDPKAYALYRRSSLAVGGISPGLLPLWERIVVLECAIALDPDFERAYSELAYCYAKAGGLVGTRAAKAKIFDLLAELKQRCPNSPAVWAIEVELETDMHELAKLCMESIARGERVYAYPHPMGFHDVRASLGHALASAGLHGEGYEYYVLIDRRDEPMRYDHWLGQLACLVAIGEFEKAVEQAARMKAVAPEPGPLVPMWEFVARMALRDYEAAEALLPMHTLPIFWFPAQEILDVARGGEVASNVLPEENLFSDTRDVSAFALLALGKVEQGLAYLNKHIHEATESGDVHWWSFRLPIYRHLFGQEVTQHLNYRQLVEALRLDAASRRTLQDSVVSRLSSITGIEPRALLEI